MDGWKQIYRILKQDPKLIHIVDLIEKSEPAFVCKSPQIFAKDQVHDIIAQQMKKMDLEPLQKAISKIGTLPQITAKVIKATKTYTLALLIIPPQMVFGWHNHPHMNGISRCVAGQLMIRSIDPNKFEKVGEKNNTFRYLQKDLRIQVLKPKGESISIIYPQTFNIHQIKAGKTQSAFIDLLIPQYPKGSCEYFRTVQDCVQHPDLIVEASIECQQNVVGSDQYIKMLMKSKP